MRCLKILDFNPMIYPIILKLTSLAPDGVVRIGVEHVYAELTRRLIMEVATKPYADYDTDYLIVNDSDHYFRRDLYSEYKGKRSPKPSCYSTACQSLSGIPHKVQHGYEADDLIAYAVLKHHKDYDKIRIYTCDGDMNQLIDFKTEVVQTTIYNPEEAILDEATCERWFTKRVMHRHPKAQRHIKIWKPPTLKPVSKYWVGTCKDSVLKMKLEHGDVSDNYPAGMERVIYDLFISPIHQLNIDLQIQSTDEETHEAWVQSLDKWTRKGNSVIRDWFTDPYEPSGDPAYSGVAELSGFGWS